MGQTRVEGRGVTQLPRRGGTAGAVGARVGASRLRPGRGGAGRCPPPGGPLPRAAPLCRARRSHSRLRKAGSWGPKPECGQAGLGCLAGSAAAPAGESGAPSRRASGGRGGQDRAVGEPRGSSAGAGGYVSTEGLGSPRPRAPRVSRIGMLRNPRPWTRVSAPVLWSRRARALRVRRQVRIQTLGTPGARAWRTEGSGPQRWRGSLPERGCPVGIPGAPSAGRRGTEGGSGV